MISLFFFPFLKLINLCSGGGFNVKNFPYEMQCFFENYEESSLKEEGLIEFIDENGLEIKTLNGFSIFIFYF